MLGVPLDQHSVSVCAVMVALGHTGGSCWSWLPAPAHSLPSLTFTRSLDGFFLMFIFKRRLILHSEQPSNINNLCHMSPDYQRINYSSGFPLPCFPLMLLLWIHIDVHFACKNPTSPRAG